MTDTPDNRKEISHIDRIDYWSMNEKILIAAFIDRGCLQHCACPVCHFMYRDSGQIKCPNCGYELNGTFAAWNTAALDGYLRAISVILKTRRDMADQARSELWERLSRIRHIEGKWDDIERLVLDLWRLYPKKKNVVSLDSAYKKMLGLIEKRFNINEERRVREVLGVLLNYQTPRELDGLLVLAANTLFEAGFNSFLRVLASLIGRFSCYKCRAENKELNKKGRDILFKDLTGITRDKYIKENNWASFWSEYSKLNKTRNKYVHGDWMSISDSDVSDALKCAGASLDFFMELNNRFCVKTT